MAQQTDADDEAQTETELESTVKVRWEGYARSRIAEYNWDYTSHESDLVEAALGRFKTLVACETFEEAEALRKELTHYNSDQRTWMNSSQDRALARVRSEMDEQMADMGWEVLRTSRRSFKAYVPADEVEERQAEVHENARQYQEDKEQNEQRARDVTEADREELEGIEDVRSARSSVTSPDPDGASIKVRTTSQEAAEAAMAYLESEGYGDVRTDTTFEDRPQVWAEVPADMMREDDGEQEADQETEGSEDDGEGDTLMADGGHPVDMNTREAVVKPKPTGAVQITAPDDAGRAQTVYVAEERLREALGEQEDGGGDGGRTLACTQCGWYRANDEAVTEAATTMECPNCGGSLEVRE